MSNAEARYQARIDYPEMIERARAQTLNIRTYLAGADSYPASGTISVYDASNTAIVDAVATSGGGGSAFASYPLLAATIPDTLAFSIGYRIEWALVMADGETHTFRQDAFLTRRVLQVPITNSDLTDLYDDLSSLVSTPTTKLQTKIYAAWKQVVGGLVTAGLLPQRIISGWSLRQPMIDLTLALIFADMYATTGGTDGKYLALSQKHYGRVPEMFRAPGDTNFAYDSDGDGHDDDPQNREGGAASVWLGSAPTTTRWVR